MFKETKIKALNNISFNVKRGETVAIMGDVGSGKSTILELISGVYKPDYGNILIDNANTKNIKRLMATYPNQHHDQSF